MSLLAFVCCCAAAALPGSKARRLGEQWASRVPPAWTGSLAQSNAQFSISLAGVGDVNGDGFDDVAVGAPRFEDRGGVLGNLFVFYGSTNGLGATPDWTLTGEQPGDGFAEKVAGIGDVNGDEPRELLRG